jgi:putative hydrolase of the HAD superfamily
MIEALILDYGGVVIHEDPADYEPIGRSLGFGEGQLWAAVHSIPEYLPSRVGQLSAVQFRDAVRRHLSRIAGQPAADAALAALEDYYRAHQAVRDVMQPLLATLKGKVPMAVLSNAARGSTERFVQQGLSEHFDAVLCSGDIGVAKPDFAAFRLAARRLGAAVERCAFVDDTLEHVVTARCLGMDALLYHHTRHGELAEALRRWRLLP